ncbi:MULTISPECIES: rodlin [Streptomyces]
MSIDPHISVSSRSDRRSDHYSQNRSDCVRHLRPACRHANRSLGRPRASTDEPIQGTLNKPCIGIGKLGLQSLIALINVGVQDVPVLQGQQQCTDNSTINDGDDALSHILNEIPVLSGRG